MTSPRISRRELEERYQCLFEGSQDSIVVTDLAGKIVACNRQAAILHGYDEPEEVLGKSLEDLVAPEDRQEAAEAMRRLTTEGHVLDLDFSLLHKDGSRFRLNLGASLILGANGMPHGFIGVGRDLSAQHETIEDLHESETSFRALADNANDGILIETATGRHVYCNARVARITGYSVEQLLQRDPCTLTHPNAPRTGRHPLQDQNAEDPTPAQFETVIVRPDGVQVPVEITTSPTGWRGEPATLVIMRDVSERKLAEEALRASEARYRTLVDNAPIGVYRTTPAGHIVDANPALIRMLGYRSFEELARRDLEKDGFEPQYERSEFRARLERDGEVVGLESAWKRKDGAVLYLRENAKAIRNAQGEIECYEGTVEDVTERRQVEEAVRRARDELEENVRARTADLEETNRQLRREITRRERVETALRESEDRFRAIAEATPIPVVIAHQPDGRIVYANNHLARTFGLSAEEALGRYTVEFYCDPQDREVLWRTLDERGFLRNHEVHLKKADGTPFWAAVSAELLVFEGQDAILAGFHDITERKRAEDELRKFKTISDKANYGTAIVDLEGNIIYVNRTFAEMHQYTPAELMGKNLSTFHTEDQMLQVDELNQRVIREGSYIAEEVWHRRRDGSVFPALMNANVIPGEHGTSAFLSATAIDITERKEAEQALQESEQRLRTVIEASKDAIVAIDRAGLVTIFNPAAEQMFGRSNVEMIGHTLDCLMPPEYRAHHGRYVGEYFRTGKARRVVGTTVELPALRADGTVFPIELSLSASAKGPEVLVLAVMRDITERKQAETILLQAKEAAEAANRAKTDFLAKMSHEIRTPIMAMLGAAELSRSQPESPQPESADIVLRNGRHLLALIDDLLDISKLEAGKLHVSLTDCSLSELLADVKAVVAPLHQRPEVEFRLVYDTPVPGTIHTDPLRLKQALINLISNALKFTEEGFVTVRVRVDPEAVEPRLTLAVEDTGPGIAAPDLERIFEEFAQLELGSSRALGGVGLGLSVAKWIAEQLGGSLEVTSSLGEGSTFTLRIATGPLDREGFNHPESESVAARATHTAPAARSLALNCARLMGRVLLAEDFADTRELMRAALEAAGAEVVAVSNGVEALQAVEQGDFDLMLLDIRMPKMDGLTAARALRRRGCLTPLVALTASVAPRERARVLEAGFDDFWPKPMSLEQLIELASAYLACVPPEEKPSVTHADPGASLPEATTKTCAGKSGAGLLACDPRLAAVAAGFARSLPRRLQALEDALASADYRGLREVLHQLVGSAGVHGFDAISAEAARLMRWLDTGPPPPEADTLAALRHLVSQATVDQSDSEDSR